MAKELGKRSVEPKPSPVGRWVQPWYPWSCFSALDGTGGAGRADRLGDNHGRVTGSKGPGEVGVWPRTSTLQGVGPVYSQVAPA